MTRSTSIAAYNAIKDNGLLSKRRWQVYDYVFRYGPCTAKQVTDNVPGGWKRLSELFEIGLVVETGTTTCHQTNQTVIVWDVTDNLPEAVPPRSKTKLQETREKLKTSQELLRVARELLSSNQIDPDKRRRLIDDAGDLLGIPRQKQKTLLERIREKRSQKILKSDTQS